MIFETNKLAVSSFRSQVRTRLHDLSEGCATWISGVCEGATVFWSWSTYVMDFQLRLNWALQSWVKIYCEGDMFVSFVMMCVNHLNLYGIHWEETCWYNFMYCTAWVSWNFWCLILTFQFCSFLPSSTFTIISMGLPFSKPHLSKCSVQQVKLHNSTTLAVSSFHNLYR